MHFLTMNSKINNNGKSSRFNKIRDERSMDITLSELNMGIPTIVGSFFSAYYLGNYWIERT